MPKTITKYRIFLASPSDLNEARVAFDDVIQELNLTFGKLNDISLELLKWETHSAPAISLSNQQKIISDDLGDDYDLFIGLLWKKFGTPTDEADSGTEEEFLNAYNRFLKSPNSLQILFYFNTSPIPFSEINPEQIKKILDFKSDLEKNKNLLYWEYQNIQQLNKFLRIHIPQRILELQKKQQTEFESKDPEEGLAKKVAIEEFGLIDYQEMSEDYMNESTESLQRIGESITWIGEQLNKKTNEMNALTSGSVQPGRKTLKDFFTRTAKVMDNFANRIEPEISIFYDNFEKGIDAYSNQINISRNDLNVNEDEINETKESLEVLIIAIADSIEGTESFLQSVKDLPRMSKEINRAKSNVSEKLENLLNNIVISHSIALELQKSIDE